MAARVRSVIFSGARRAVLEQGPRNDGSGRTGGAAHPAQAPGAARLRLRALAVLQEQMGRGRRQTAGYPVAGGLREDPLRDERGDPPGPGGVPAFREQPVRPEKGTRPRPGDVGAGGPGQSERGLEWMKEVKPTVFYGTPSYSLYLAEKARAMGMDPRRDFNFRILFFSGEPRAGVVSTRKRIEETYGGICSD